MNNRLEQKGNGIYRADGEGTIMEQDMELIKSGEFIIASISCCLLRIRHYLYAPDEKGYLEDALAALDGIMLDAGILSRHITERNAREQQHE